MRPRTANRRIARRFALAFVVVGALGVIELWSGFTLDQPDAVLMVVALCSLGQLGTAGTTITANRRDVHRVQVYYARLTDPDDDPETDPQTDR